MWTPRVRERKEWAGVWVSPISERKGRENRKIEKKSELDRAETNPTSQNFCAGLFSF